MQPAWVKVAATVAPLLLGALVTIAWQNSQTLAVLTTQMTMMRADIEKAERLACPPRSP